jgi:hypothetical protein
MKGFIRSLVGRIPEGVYHRSLKTVVEVVEGSINDLLWDSMLYRYAVQRIVDTLWNLNKIPNGAQAHQMFYNILRSYGFRAYVAKNIYDSVLALVKAVM